LHPNDKWEIRSSPWVAYLKEVKNPYENPKA
jgi:hypothetical protein